MTAENLKQRILAWRRRPPVLLLAVLVALSGIVVFQIMNAVTTTRDEVVRKYLHALADHDASAALAQSVTQPGNRAFLTDDALAAQQKIAPITDIHASAVKYSPNDVHVRFRYGSQKVDESITLVRTGRSWKLPSATIQVDVSQWSEVPAKLFGVTVGPASYVNVFPGPLVWTSTNPNLQLLPGAWAALPDSGTTSAPYVKATSAAGPNVDHAVRDAVAQCAASRSSRPVGCGRALRINDETIPEDWDVVEGSVTYAQVSYPPSGCIDSTTLTRTLASGQCDVTFRATFTIENAQGQQLSLSQTIPVSWRATVDLAQMPLEADLG